MQTGMKSDVPLILTQIRPLSTNSDDITISKNDVVGNSKGYIADFVLNHVAQALYPKVSIVWKYKDRVRHILIQVSP